MNASRLEKSCLKLMDRHLQQIRHGSLELELPDGSKRVYGDGTAPERMRINSYAFFPQVVLAGNIGFGEAWTAEDWDSDNLTGVLELLVKNMPSLKKSGITSAWGKRLGHLAAHALNHNSRSGSRRNIQAHYDLGNDFYRLFLDHETMMYSAAVFERPDEALQQAQLRKIRKLIERADIRQQDHVLEIGCGWGGFAIEAARLTGCRVTGITLSDEQYRYARERVEQEGLGDQVDIRICDYRDVQGSFDRIVSIEMLEAVGHRYYGTFFETCDRVLKPGGRIALQVITIPDQRYDSYRRNPDWIQKHIFPGGMLPSLNELTKAMTLHSSLTVDHLDNIGIHYAETLRRWRAAFVDNREALLQLGYDETFQRKWLYYLCYCEAGFQTRFINDLHLTLVRPSGPSAGQ